MSRGGAHSGESGIGIGIGIEYTHEILRAVRVERVQPLGADDAPQRRQYDVAAAVEVPLRDAHDDRVLLDAFVRLRAELGGPPLPTRIATFPSGSSMRRVDVTGKTGPELNALRATIDDDHGASSTVLVDNGPRRWMFILNWDPTRLRRLEELAERAGFIDVSVDPSPLALARVCPPSTTCAERSSATDESFVLAMDAGTVTAAATIDTVGRTHPDLLLGQESYSVTMFDDIDDGVGLADQLAIVARTQHFGADGVELQLAESSYPNFPPHDLRSPERQCVAIGAAVGASGLAGRLRPIDIVNAEVATSADVPRPWAIERMSGVPDIVAPTRPGPARRLTSRLRPRRSK